MQFEVALTSKAQSQLQKSYEWYVEHAPEYAADWYNGFLDVLSSLESNPERCGLARESDRFSIPLHDILYGVGRKKTHRAVFAIRPGKVVVYSIRHTSQQDLNLDGPEEFLPEEGN